MTLFIFTFVLIVVVAAAMAVGVMIKNKSMSSSCGGLGAMGIDKVCDCDEPCDRRKERMAREKSWQDNRII